MLYGLADTCPDGFKMPGYLVRPGSVQRLPAIVCVIDIFGLGPEMKRVADDFAAEGYVALMPNLFMSKPPDPVVGLLLHAALWRTPHLTRPFRF